jgi:hypothetical protein
MESVKQPIMSFEGRRIHANLPNYRSQDCLLPASRLGRLFVVPHYWFPLK